MNLSLYEQLGLPRDASQEEIRHAYRQLVLRLHPDLNSKKGETDRFLEIQQAYEQLSDPIRKIDYDRQLPDDLVVSSPLNILTYYSQPSLVRMAEPQLIYALLNLKIHPDMDQLASTAPLNISLVVDCSTSMQGIRLDSVKSTAIELVRQLGRNDIFSLVKFNDRAELLLPAGSISDLRSVEMKIQLLQAGGGTEIFKGLQIGFDQINEFRSANRINHIILITDGRTYGDETNCENLASQSSALGISISALGIGNQWNDRFLDRLTSKTGGICKYISDLSDIRSSILDEISRLGANLTEQITYNFQTPEDVELHSAFRIKPDSSPLPIGSPIIFGHIPENGTMSILLEFLIKDIPPSTTSQKLAKGFIVFEIPRHKEKSRFIQRLSLDRIITREPILQSPPTTILNAMATLNIYLMQERAREEMAAGDIASATRHMKNLATHLLQNGEKILAQTVLDEVAYINQHQSFSEDGEKRIKYGTRSLLLTAGSEDSNL